MSDYSMTVTSSGTRDYRNAHQTLKKGEHMFLWYHLKSVWFQMFIVEAISVTSKIKEIQ